MINLNIKTALDLGHAKLTEFNCGCWRKNSKSNTSVCCCSQHQPWVPAILNALAPNYDKRSIN